ncbi:MAG: hypothetical protein BroJett003_19390 [Planctomycetota bacterium]|nr:MAG: hypothetical protein BroJett003_19390 [Planctomycetota bacterium]
MKKFGLAALACALLGVTAAAQELDLAYTEPVWPVKIAKVYADGTRGPWIEYTIPNLQQVAGFSPIWDSYEADPALWNNVDNVACEVYDLPPGSGAFCLGPCDGRRYRWCHQNNGCGFRATPACISGNGGDMAANAPGLATVHTFLWGTDAAYPNGQALEIEFRFFGTYRMTTCPGEDTGSGQLDGVVYSFNPPAANSFFRTTVDLSVLPDGGVVMPNAGRMAFHQVHWIEFDTQTPNPNVYHGLWPTKTGWEAVMGKDEARGVSDHHGNRDCVADPADCVFGGAVCPSGDGNTGPAGLLLGPADSCPSDACNGNESLNAKTKLKGGDCQAKLIMKRGTPGSVYGVVSSTGQCTTKAANARGKVVVKERPSQDGTASVPSCGLTANVDCP